MSHKSAPPTVSTIGIDLDKNGFDALSPRMVNLIAELAQDWRRLDEGIAAVSDEIESLAEQDEACQRVMTVPGVGPIISSAVVAAIGNGAGFTQGRDFGAWLEIARSWARSLSAATSICGRCSCRPHTSC
jgi:transposase